MKTRIVIKRRPNGGIIISQGTSYVLLTPEEMPKLAKLIMEIHAEYDPEETIIEAFDL